MRIALAAALAALALSACQDPAGVGLGLIDDEQSDPSVVTVGLEGLAAFDVKAPAIGIADPGNARSQSRVVVGSVLDPVFGDAQAVGYVDVLQPTTAQALNPDQISAAFLVLRRDYVYGDTTTALPVALRQVQGSWDADPSYSADTLFATGPVLTQTTVALADTLVRFDLPQSWVRANAQTLVSTTFADDFEGFALQAADGFAPAPGAVFGLGVYAAAGASLRVVTEEDTLDFRLSEVFSSIASGPPTGAPAGLLPLRRNSGRAVGFTADLSGVRALPLARALLRLPVDRSYREVGTFVRPLPSAASTVVYGVRDRDDGGEPDRVLLGFATVTDADELDVIDTTALTQILQGVIANPRTAAFDRYELRPGYTTRVGVPPVDYSPASLDVLPLVLPVGDRARDPRLTLTVVGDARPTAAR